jgi:uncharacterized protein (TIGR00369 family)
MSETARQWLESSAFHAFLGLETLEVAEDRLALRLPFDPRLTNNGAVLHGGLAAALSGIASRGLWRAAGGGGAGAAHLASLHVSYLRAADGDLHVSAQLLRAGRNVCFARVEIELPSGRRVAEALATVRLRSVRAAGARPHGALRELGPIPPVSPRPVRAPFLDQLGLERQGMGEGASQLVLPWRAELADGSGFHDGALLALLDCAGAMSSHAAHGGSAPQNATIALQAQVFGPDLPAADLLALGRCATRDEDVFWNEVQIARESTRELLARGSVVYRIADGTA